MRVSTEQRKNDVSGVKDLAVLAEKWVEKERSEVPVALIEEAGKGENKQAKTWSSGKTSAASVENELQDSSQVRSRQGNMYI